MPELDSLAPPSTSICRFQDGGAVRRGSLYVERRADRELFEALSAGEFCYVLAPRQIGKSSLRVRVEERLRERGVRCASIDLTRIGAAGITADEWYFSLVDELAMPLRLERDPAEFWAARADLSPVNRFMRFLKKEVLGAIKEPVVISIDEIDMVLSLPFSRDDFFAAIRAVYNARADDPSYERLTFCLFGVATPGELMEDPSHTPFNIGRAIRLNDFTSEEARLFLPGLSTRVAEREAEELLAAVMDWTSGHPYMTQRILSALTMDEGASQPARERVDQLVQKLFLERGRLEDPNLAYAERRLQRAQPSSLKLEMLRIYRRLLYGGALKSRGDDPAQQELRLAGMVSERTEPQGERVMIRNRIFSTVFDLAWVDENASTSPLAEPIAQWLRFGKQDDFLLHGAALEVVLDWARGRNDLGAEEREFIDACVRAEERRKAAQRAARERRMLLVAAGAVTLMMFSGVGLMRERSYRLAAEKQRREAVVRLDRARKDLSRVKEEAERKAAEAEQRAGELRKMASKLELEAREKQESKQEAELLRQEAAEARRRAEEEHAAATGAKKIAREAAEALQKSEEAALVAQQALETERAGRELAEKQLDDERKHRERVEGELKDTQEKLRETQQKVVTLERLQCWPSEAAPLRAPRPQLFDRPIGPQR